MQGLSGGESGDVPNPHVGGEEALRRRDLRLYLPLWRGEYDSEGRGPPAHHRPDADEGVRGHPLRSRFYQSKFPWTVDEYTDTTINHVLYRWADTLKRRG